jgi:hypothetical protein
MLRREKVVAVTVPVYRELSEVHTGARGASALAGICSSCGCETRQLIQPQSVAWVGVR